jgi:hypothetical protein
VSPELVSILVLIAMFAAATLLPVNMGVLALVAAFIIGGAYTDLLAEDIALLFPGDLFVLLVGITYLFAIAQSNGTIGWMVQASVRAVGGAIVLANGVDVDRQVFFPRLLTYGAIVVAVAPVLLWLALVVPGS